MNKQQVTGRVEQAKGTLKEIAGKALGDRELQVEGLLDQATGKATRKVGDLKEKVKDACN